MLAAQARNIEFAFLLLGFFFYKSRGRKDEAKFIDILQLFF